MKNQKVRTAATEEARMFEDLEAALKTKRKNLHHFADLKLEAYEEAEVVGGGVRVMKYKTTEGPFAKMRAPLSVRYVGYLPNGRVFDSGTFTFNLGRGEVISGWDLAFKHMRLGEEATIFCPSSAAYGRRGVGKDIKPYTTLIFDVTLEKLSDSSSADSAKGIMKDKIAD